eukprot:514609-Prymnesium_polylepis.1
MPWAVGTSLTLGWGGGPKPGCRSRSDRPPKLTMRVDSVRPRVLFTLSQESCPVAASGRSGLFLSRGPVSAASPSDKTHGTKWRTHCKVGE